MRNGNNRKKKPRIHLSTTKIILLICSLCVICAFMVTATILSQRVNIEESPSIEALTTTDNKTTGNTTTAINSEVYSDSGLAKNDTNTKTATNSEISVDSTTKKGTTSTTTSDTRKTLESDPKSDSAKNTQNKTSPIVKETTKSVEITKPAEVTMPVEITKPAEVIKPVEKKGILIFIFDDAGQNLTQLEPFLKIPFPVTVAVMPGLPHSAEAAELVRKSGKELILHQPMQAQNLDVNPGPGAILPDMHGDAIKTLVAKNLTEVGPVAGLNNHEGSLITESLDDIGSVLDVCKQYGIYFLDSRTTAASKAPDAAQIRNMKIWERNVFLDNTQNKKDILAEVDKGLGIADKNGHAIMIGHVWSNDLANILTELYPELIKQGYSFATISQMINGEI